MNDNERHNWINSESKQKQQGQNITVFLGFTYSKHMQSNYNLIKIGDILLPIHDKTKI